MSHFRMVYKMLYLLLAIRHSLCKTSWPQHLFFILFTSCLLVFLLRNLSLKKDLLDQVRWLCPLQLTVEQDPFSSATLTFSHLPNCPLPLHFIFIPLLLYPLNTIVVLMLQFKSWNVYKFFALKAFFPLNPVLKRWHDCEGSTLLNRLVCWQNVDRMVY